MADFGNGTIKFFILNNGEVVAFKINGMDFKNDYIRLIMKNKKIQTISYMIELLLKKNGNI